MNSSKYRSIAIDGPSGAGKSSLARRLAASLGFTYVDTGAIYRTVGLYVLRRGADTKDAVAVEKLLPEVRIELCYDAAGQQRMLLNGEDVSREIRLPEASIAASNVSAVPAVRTFLLEMQRELARTCDVLMDGRDIGTVVLPAADVKIFLTASVEDRARRRYNELTAKKMEVSYEDVLADMQLRDLQDSTRAASPLKPAADAIPVDTTGNTFEQSFQQLKSILEARLSSENNGD